VAPLFHTSPIGEESRFEDHGSSLFCALKRKTRPYEFQLARALQKKGANKMIPATHEWSLERFGTQQAAVNADDP
jgi:hypothetical protein